MMGRVKCQFRIVQAFRAFFPPGMRRGTARGGRVRRSGPEKPFGDGVYNPSMIFNLG